MRIYALTSHQGTAMPETALCGTCHASTLIRGRVQKIAAGGYGYSENDQWDHGAWHDVTDNDRVECVLCGPKIPK